MASCLGEFGNEPQTQRTRTVRTTITIVGTKSREQQKTGRPSGGRLGNRLAGRPITADQTWRNWVSNTSDHDFRRFRNNCDCSA